MNSRHDLVVGGSGMLVQLSERLANVGRTVSIIARGADRLERLASRVVHENGRIVLVPVDYRDEAALRSALATLVAAHGRPIRTICWVHDDVAPHAPLQVSEYVDGFFWHILGSAAADPARRDVLSHWRARFKRRRPDLDYRHVVLGFIAEPGVASRWLTNDEICDGVEAALKTREQMTAVGMIEPWSLRP